MNKGPGTVLGALYILNRCHCYHFAWWEIASPALLALALATTY